MASVNFIGGVAAPSTNPNKGQSGKRKINVLDYLKVESAVATCKINSLDRPLSYVTYNSIDRLFI